MSVIKPQNLSKAIKKKIDLAGKQTSKTWAKKGSKLLDLMINDSLDRGYSTENKIGKFTKYKKSTAQRKGRYSPVDLYDTGELRNSLSVKPTTGADIEAKFGDPNKILQYLNKKTKHTKAARPPLPRGNSGFNNPIKKALTALYKKLYKL